MDLLGPRNHLSTLSVRFLTNASRSFGSSIDPADAFRYYRRVEQTIPVVDLQEYRNPETRAAFVEKFGAALRELGFVAVTGYGIEQSLFDRGYEVFRQFFALEEETKKHFERPEEGRRRGYTSFGVEHAKDHSAPDLKEFFHVGRELPASHPHHARLPKNVWPEAVVPGLRSASSELYAALDDLAAELLAAFSTYLGLDEDFLPKMAKDGNTVHRIIHYPVCDGFDIPGAMRAAQHEDINLMTLLPPADESGLEILTRDGEWLPVRAIPGQIIVDTGDMMMRMTNDKVPATTHRVVNPEGEPKPRYSMPFFVHPHLEAMLEVLPSVLEEGESAKYEPINNEEFLMERLRAIGVA